MLSGFRTCCLDYEAGLSISQAWGAHTQPRQGYQLPRATLVGYSKATSTSAVASQHPTHSTNCSQNERTSCEGLRAPTSTSQVTKATTASRGVTISKASLVVVTVTVDIFVKVPIIFEGIPGGDNCTDDPGVEAIRYNKSDSS